MARSFVEVLDQGEHYLFVHKQRDNKDGTRTTGISISWKDKDGQHWEFYGNVKMEQSTKVTPG